MISLVESHPMSFMFSFLGEDDFTLADIKEAVKRGKITKIFDLELAIGRMFDDCEAMLSQLHDDIN